MSSALFGAATQTRSRNLVEFKAGKMNLKGTMVQPDKRKGLVYVHQSEDSLMHFCWKDRTNGIVEDDLIIFPDDIEIKRVHQCTTGRVFLMKFKSSNKKFFFWMQENDVEKDEKLWKKVNDSLNNPPAPGSASSSSGSAADRVANFSNALGDFGGLEGADLQSLIGSMR
jgi:26S proteasome regulatory subunit N13